jgi:hypothetical protein
MVFRPVCEMLIAGGQCNLSAGLPGVLKGKDHRLVFVNLTFPLGLRMSCVARRSSSL